MTGGHSQETALARAAAPVQVSSSEQVDVPSPGIGLWLSGGGYRAMLFHLGALWRLNTMGSITAGVLGYSVPEVRANATW